MQPDLSGKRVLVTGGTGFIGNRLVERLVQQFGAQVRVPVRKFARATRAARFPVELVSMDLTDPNDVQRAVDGCDIVLHCAYGSEGNEAKMRQITVDGTGNVVRAAAKAGCSRVVHVSTINVYGPTQDGPLDETVERVYFGDPYSDTKLDAEKLAIELCRSENAPATVVQPTIVYGPFALAWTIRILNDMKAGRIPLVNGGDGLCNAVYIDDLVDGMLLAATREEAVGECFLLSGAEPTTWREFYGHYERMLGLDATVTMSADDVRADFQQRFGAKRRRSVVREAFSILRHEPRVRGKVAGSFEAHALRSAARKILPVPVRRTIGKTLRGQRGGRATAGGAATAATATAERPLQPMAPAAIDVHAAKTAVQIGKAQRLLGYAPQFDLATGMARTAEWARWAGYTS